MIRETKRRRINYLETMDNNNSNKSKEEERQENDVELSDLSDELIEELLCRVPIKSRARLKSVSKNWRNYIDRLRQSIPLTTSKGLVIFLTCGNPIRSYSNFIQIKDQTLAQLYSTQFHSFHYLLDSCNGLLLYGTNDGYYWTYHVSSPFLDNPIALPPAHTTARPASASLVFDGEGYTQFRVVCFFWNEVDFEAKKVKYLVFSSNEWKWRENEATILNLELMREGDFVVGECFRPSVYFRRRLYWIWSLCLLVYDDEVEIFKLVRLPCKKSLKSNNDYLNQLLWESEGRIHFCSPANQGFSVWAYLDDDDDCDLMWQFKRLVELDDLILGKIKKIYAASGMIGNRVWSRRMLKPVAFNEDLQLLYLQVLPGIIVSFSFETQRLERVWSLVEPSDDLCMCDVFPFLFNSRN